MSWMHVTNGWSAGKADNLIHLTAILIFRGLPQPPSLITTLSRRLNIPQTKKHKQSKIKPIKNPYQNNLETACVSSLNQMRPKNINFSSMSTWIRELN